MAQWIYLLQKENTEFLKSFGGDIVFFVDRSDVEKMQKEFNQSKIVRLVRYYKPRGPKPIRKK